MSKILVTGDIILDKLKWNIKKPVRVNKRNWQLYDVYDTVNRWGGALLLADMIDKSSKDITVYSYQKNQLKGDNNNKKNFIESMSHLEECGNRFVMKKFLGYHAPGKENDLKIDPIDDDDVDILVIHDAGNIFRNDPNSPNNNTPYSWPKLDGCDAIVHKISRPIAEGDLWAKICSKEELIVVIDVDDLREKGLRISRSLSWERTAQDFLKEMNNIKNGKKYDDLKDLTKCKNLIVRFGIDGVIHYRDNGNNGEYYLFFDPEVFERGHKNELSGSVQGKGSAFVSGLVFELQKDNSKFLESINRKLCSNKKYSPGTYTRLNTSEINFLAENPDDVSFNEKIELGIKRGILFSRNLVKYGYVKNTNDRKMDFPFTKMFTFNKTEINKIRKVEIKDTDNWKILESTLVSENELINESEDKIYQLAREYVLKGKSPDLKASIAVFGKLRTADRSEIESYHSIKNLIKEYLNIKKVEKPLSIAVFGPPGSGKSFGVTEIANTISSDIEKLEFNLSQFQSPNDLLSAFHIVQSTAIEGKIPLVFFDEFDCKLDVLYGWLKYFLSPMNDGVFKQGERIHPIGKSIFVFAGGTARTFEEFNPEEGVKGSDFKSRLRGFVNIVGINKTEDGDRNEKINQNKIQRCIDMIDRKFAKDTSNDNISVNDNLFMIRRAMILRTMLEKRAENIFEKDSTDNKTANIDNSVLKAFLKVPAYKHGLRSMEAIIEMSALSQKQKFERSALPSSEQLELHVDAEKFKRILNESP